MLPPLRTTVPLYPESCPTMYVTGALFVPLTSCQVVLVSQYVCETLPPLIYTVSPGFTPEAKFRFVHALAQFVPTFALDDKELSTYQAAAWEEDATRDSRMRAKATIFQAPVIAMRVLTKLRGASNGLERNSANGRDFL